MDILFKDLEEDVNMQDWEKNKIHCPEGMIRRIKTVWTGRVGKHPRVNDQPPVLQTSGYWSRGEGNIEVREWEAQTTGY